MGSNPDYLNDLESFLDNPAALMSTSPNPPVMSPLGQTNPMSNGVGVRDRLRHHLNGEKRKLEDASDVMPKTQRTDDHGLMMLDGLDHEHTFKTEDMKAEPDLKDEQPQGGFGGQGGLLAQALMDKRPSSTNGHLNSPAGFFGVGSPRPVGSPAVLAPPGSPDMMALKQQIDAIKNTPSLNEEQRNAKITEFIRQHPQLKRRILMHSKMNNEKMRQAMGQDLLMQRDQVQGGGNMMVQDYGPGPGYPPNSGNNDNAFMPGPYMDNIGMQGFGGPGGPAATSGPRSRGRGNLPPANMNNMYPGPMQSEMWDMGNKCVPSQMPTQPQQHLHPPPQYSYRQPGPVPRPNNMMNSIGQSCYNSPQNEYMATGMYGQQQQLYPGQRGGVGVMGEPLYPNEPLGQGPMGVRGFNPPGYPGGGMRMVNPAYPADGFQNDYMIPNGGRNVRHQDFMYHQQQQQQQHQQHQHRSMNPQHPMGFGPQQHQRGLAPNFGMATSPRLPGSIGQMSPVMSPPMHSPATAQMPMGTPNSQTSVYNNNNNSSSSGNNNNNNNNGNAFNLQNGTSNNGFHFHDDFPGPPIQSPGILGSNGMTEDNGIDSLLGPDDGLLGPTIPAAPNTSWKLNAAELRRDLLQRLTNALKDSHSGAGLDSEASAMEEEAFNSCDTEESYYHRLAQMLASKFSTIQENQPQTPTSYPDSTTLQDSVSCPKLSSSTDGATETSGGDLLAKANPILAESLAATNDDLISAAAPPGVESKDSCELFSSSSSASSSPVSSSVTMATASMSSSSPSLAPSILSNGSSNPPLRKADNFHRPNTDAGEKGLHRTVNGRRPSGKGNTTTPTTATNGNNNNNNNPHSVDSGIGSPRSTTSTSLYSPKLHGTSPSLVAVANLESSPGKLS